MQCCGKIPLPQAAQASKQAGDIILLTLIIFYVVHVFKNFFCKILFHDKQWQQSTLFYAGFGMIPVPNKAGTKEMRLDCGVCRNRIDCETRVIRGRGDDFSS